jgi:hypothetical protein
MSFLASPVCGKIYTEEVVNADSIACSALICTSSAIMRIPQNFIPRILSTDNACFTRHEKGNGIWLKSCNSIKDQFQGWCDTADIFILGLSCHDHNLDTGVTSLAMRYL